MTWTRLSDDHFDKPQMFEVCRDARLLDIELTVYSNRHLTDGMIRRSLLNPRITDAPDPHALMGELVAAGLWEEVDEGFQKANWAQLQPTAEKVQAEREETARRQKRQRLHNRGDHSMCDPGRCWKLRGGGVHGADRGQVDVDKGGQVDVQVSTVGHTHTPEDHQPVTRSSTDCENVTRDSRVSHGLPSRSRPVPFPTHREGTRTREEVTETSDSPDGAGAPPARLGSAEEVIAGHGVTARPITGDPKRDAEYLASFFDDPKIVTEHVDSWLPMFDGSPYGHPAPGKIQPYIVLENSEPRLRQEALSFGEKHFAWKGAHNIDGRAVRTYVHYLAGWLPFDHPWLVRFDIQHGDGQPEGLAEYGAMPPDAVGLRRLRAGADPALLTVECGYGTEVDDYLAFRLLDALGLWKRTGVPVEVVPTSGPLVDEVREYLRWLQGKPNMLTHAHMGEFHYGLLVDSPAAQRAVDAGALKYIDFGGRIKPHGREGFLTYWRELCEATIEWENSLGYTEHDTWEDVTEWDVRNFVRALRQCHGLPLRLDDVPRDADGIRMFDKPAGWTPDGELPKRGEVESQTMVSS